MPKITKYRTGKFSIWGLVFGECSGNWLSLHQRSEMLKIGVLGAGHLGRIHIKLLKASTDFDLLGFYDPDAESVSRAVEEYGVKAFESMEELIDQVDCVDIVTPTLSHFTCAMAAIRNQKHVFIEKPLTNTLDEGKELVSLIEEANVKGMVGHVERFNPALLSLGASKLEPLFFETHRLANFNPRGTDVSVVLDLMIHDIDIVLSLVRSGVKRISANGVSIVSDTPDIANARIEFDNGCVANLTASRISMKNLRKTRIFQKDAYIGLDFLDKKVEIIRISEESPSEGGLELETNKGKKWITMEMPEILPVNSIAEELAEFAAAIREDRETAVPLSDGFASMKVAYEILDKIELQSMPAKTSK